MGCRAGGMRVSPAQTADATRRPFARGASLHVPGVAPDRRADLAARSGTGERGGAGRHGPADHSGGASRATGVAYACVALGADTRAAARPGTALGLDFGSSSAHRDSVGPGLGKAAWRSRAPHHRSVRFSVRAVFLLARRTEHPPNDSRIPPV